MVILLDGVGCKTLDTELVISAVCSQLRSKKTKEQARMLLTVQILNNRRLKSSGTVLFR